MQITKTVAKYCGNLAGALAGKPSALVWNTSGYNAATNGRRMITVGSSTRGVSSLALADGPMLLARARKAGMDNPLVANGITSFNAEVIGTGIRPHSKHSNPTTRRKLEMEFHLWVAQASAARRIGADGKPDSLQDFYTLEGLMCRNTVEAGEAFARLRPRLAADLSPTGLRVPLQIDLIEPEQLAFWRMSGDMASPDNIVRGGIEFNPIHERVAYHFYRDHPGDSTIWPNAFEVVRVPSGNVLHIMEFIRGNQIRGITSLAPILVQLADLDDYDDAERMRQKLGAYLFGWKKTLTPDDPQLAGLTTVGTDVAPAGSAYVEAQPGQFNILDTNAGEEFGFYAHPGVSNQYETFMRVQRQTIATILRNSYEMLTGDMNQVNYSSARVRLIALRRIWEQFQKSVIAHQFCRPVWRAWLDAAALAGVIDAADYRKNPEEYLNVEWLAQPWEWIDPKSDVAAIRMAIESCLTSREAQITARGEDATEVDEQIKRDHDREKRLGIVPVYGNSRVSETVPPGDNEELAGTEPVPPDSAPVPAKRRALKKSARLEEITQRIGARPALIRMQDASKSFGDAPPYRIEDGIAIINIVGVLSNDVWGLGASTYGEIQAQVSTAAIDPDVKGIILNVNSPGGECDNAFETADIIAATATQKPCFAVAGTLAASAAYLLAAEAHRIYCPATTGAVGSIGVCLTHMDVSGALKQAGITPTQLSAGEGKTDGNPYEALTPTARKDMQAEVDRLYAEFVNAVSKGRRMRSQDVVKLGAKMFRGSENAIASGLADAAGDISTAWADMRVAINKQGGKL